MTPVVWQEQLDQVIWSVGVRGRLDHGAIPHLEAALGHLLDEGHVQLVVDMGQVSYINSGGLRVLISAWRTARQNGGDLLLCGLNQRLTEIFEIAGFDQVFRIHVTPGNCVRALLDDGPAQ